jgi:uncharacterized YceG family protein
MSRSEEERERARADRAARRAARADRTSAVERPQIREKAEAAIARSAERPRVPAEPSVSASTGNGDAPRGQHRPGRGRSRALGVVAILLGLLVLAAIWFLVSLFQPGKGDGGDKVAVRVPPGGGVGVIANRLDKAGVISSPFFFKLRARLDGHTSDLKPGNYVLRKDMAYGDVLSTLSKGVPKRVINITIPEGRARREVAPLVKQAGVAGSYIRASERSPRLDPRRYRAPRGASLEGFLFPATYELKRGATAPTLVARQLSAFKQNFAKVDLSYARKKNLTRYDVLTIASMVEREAQLDKERPLIASVIYNRLKEGIPLGIDATIRYATGNWSRPLRMSELRIKSAYNTRTRQGLPPGPIGSPGIASIRAAARPARTKFLFYVVTPGTCGKHSFSATDAAFQRDVAKYNAARKKKGGKSPTTC